MKYVPAVGASLSAADAQTCGEFLDGLGQFTPLDVVTAWQSGNAPAAVSKQFTADLQKSAEKNWLQEARHLINTISVVIYQNDKPVETKAFYSLDITGPQEESERRYTSIRIVSAQPDMRQQVIERALQELEGWRGRYEQYQQIFGADIFKVIKKTVPRARRRAAEPPPPPPPV